MVPPSSQYSIKVNAPDRSIKQLVIDVLHGINRNKDRLKTELKEVFSRIIDNIDDPQFELSQATAMHLKIMNTAETINKHKI